MLAHASLHRLDIKRQSIKSQNTVSTNSSFIHFLKLEKLYVRSRIFHALLAILQIRDQICMHSHTSISLLILFT